MPLINRKEFQRAALPDGVDSTTEVFYLETSEEAFLDYEQYFQRCMVMNSMAWQCSMTGKTGLTFEEAKQSEKEALEDIETFPEPLRRAIFYLVHHSSCRAKIEDLINDIYNFIRERFIIGDEIKYRDREAGKRTKRSVRVLSVIYEGDPIASTSTQQDGEMLSSKHSPDAKNGEENEEEGKKFPSSEENKGSRSVLVPASSSYRYNVELLEEDRDDESGSDGSEDESGDEEKHEKRRPDRSHPKAEGDEEDSPTVIEGIINTDLLRGRFTATKPRVRVLLKQHCEMVDGRWDVKAQLIEELDLDSVNWSTMFAGPIPRFAQSKVVAKPPKKSVETATAKRKPEKVEEETPPVKKPRKSSTEPKPSKSSKEERKLAKLKKKIDEQQEELAPLMEQGKLCGLEDEALAQWTQSERLLNAEEIQQLKELVKETKETERKRLLEAAKEKKRQEREQAAERLKEWRKPRDDLQCEDHKPLPTYDEFKLPDWVPYEIYGDLLTAHAFFRTFAELLPRAKGERPITVGELASAVCSKTLDNTIYLRLLERLLSARRECAEQEDFDEADIDDVGQIGSEVHCDLEHRQHGQKICDRNREHEKQREIHGISVRHLHMDILTVTEVLRLTLLTSGYYPGFDIVKSRQHSRGGIHCYEDDGYLLTERNPQLMAKLETESVFELDAVEKLSLISVLTQQLLSYSKFRGLIDSRVQDHSECKRKLKELQQWHAQQKREALDARQAKEAEEKEQDQDQEGEEADERKPTQPKKKISKELQLLRVYLRAVNSGLRVQNKAEIKKIALNSFPYAEMDLAEIEEFRQIQRSFYNEKAEKLIGNVFDQQSKLGLNLLGRDRAYRTYSYYELDADRLLVLIECPDVKSIPLCSDPTPLPNEECMEAADEGTSSETANGEVRDTTDAGAAAVAGTSAKDSEAPLRLAHKLTVCTGEERSCPIHGVETFPPQLLYFARENGIQDILDALNRRGFRETELAENLIFFLRTLTDKMNATAETLADTEEGLVLPQLFGFPPTAEEFAANSGGEADTRARLEKLLKNAILKLEKKLDVNDKRFGSVSSTLDRSAWRECFAGSGDTSSLCLGGQLPLQHSLDDEILYTKEQLRAEDLSHVQKLGITILQLAHGLNFDAWKEPFVLEDKKRGKLPSTHYVSWQRSVAGCHSLSALALHLKTMELSINWNYIRPWLKQKCRACGRSIGSAKYVCCIDCERHFHLKCSQIDVPPHGDDDYVPLPAKWTCSYCDEQEETGEEDDPKNKDEPAKGGEHNAAELSNGTDLNDLYTTEGPSSTENHFGNGSSTAANDDSSGEDKERKDGVSEETETVQSLESRKRRARRFANFLYVDERNSSSGNDSESESRLRKRERPPPKEELAYRALSMGLRETDNVRKNQMTECEIAIKSALKMDFADPFSYPVTDKEVPGYSAVISQPMDLSTMVNKLKRLDYPSAKSVWEDLLLIHSNCKTFNEDESPISKNADELKDFLKPKFERVLNTKLV